MKKAISKLLLAAVFMLCYISAFAHDFEVDGVYYKILNSTNKTLEVTYQGSSYSSYSNEYTGVVVVPSTVTYNDATYTVVSIGSSAFRDCITLTSVTIPEGVTAINSYAFSGCVCLTSVTIPASVTSIAQYAFNGCTGLSEVTIPGVTSIDNYAFATCSGVKNVAIGESITSIGAYAFSGCTGLTSITIPESTTSIGNKAFENCTAMTTVNFNAKDCSMGSSDHPVFTNCTHISTINIGENVEVIPAYAFKGCSGLTSIAIPEGVTSIYTYAFYGCSGMKEVTIPKSVASIGTYAFYGCSSLTSVVIPDGVTTIRDYTFCNCYSLATVEIPESVTSIGVRAFEDCDGMTTITIPGSVTSIGNYAFYHCSKLAEISIPNSVTSVGDYLFLDCSKLENVVIPESISSISAYTFQGCKALASVNIPGSITTIGKGAFYSSGLTSVSIPNSVTSIGQYAFSNCDSLSQITIPESVISIDSYAFSECGALGTVTIPNSVIYLGTHAFYNSDGLKQIVIPESLSLIRDYTFYDCDGLTEITIPNSVTSIGEYTFEDCSNLVSLTLGSNLSSIGKYAFRYCAGLNVIHATGSIPPSIYDSNVFYNVNKSIPVYVPTGCVEAYKKASYWSSFSTILEEENTEPLPDGARLYVDNVYYLVKSSVDRTLCVTYKGDSYSSYSDEYYGKIVIPDSVTFHGVTYAVTEIGTEAFRGCTGLITLTIGKNIKSIGNSAFDNCTKLKKLTLQDGESTLELGYNSNYNNGLFYFSTIDTLYIGRNLSYQYAPFKNIEELKSVTIGDNVTRIGNSIFYNCTALSSVAMGKNVTAIGNSAFYNCDGLKEITIPNSVTTIGEYAFYDCDGLKEITIPDSVTSIGNYVFNECSNLTDVTVGGGVTSVGNYAFYTCTKLRKLTLQDGKATLSLGDNGGSSGLFYNCPIDTLYLGRNLSYQYAPFKNIEELKSVTIGDNVTRITNSVFRYCTALSSVAMGKNVTAIGNSAFYDCDGLKEITIPNSVTSIGNSAFYDCDSLASVTIGSSVTSIGDYAFFYCEALKSVTIGSSVTSIGNSVFYNCSNLAEIHVKATTPPTLANGDVFYNVNKSIPVYVPAGCASAYRNATYWKAFTNIIALSDDVFVSGGIYYKITSEEEGTVAVTFCGGTYNEYANEYTGAVAIPESVTHNDVVYRVTSIANEAFRNCTTLTKVDIPNSITSIGDYAFATCTGLTTVTIGNGVAAIGNRAFENCHALKSISIPQGVTSIGDYAFSNCSGLTEITIPGSVTSIGIGALAGCSGVNSIVVEEGNTMYDSRDNCNAIVETATNKLIAGCKNSVIPGSVTAIGDYAFSGVTGLRTILIPKDVTSIGVSAFSACSGLEEIGVEAVVPPTIVVTTFDGVNKSIPVYVPAGCAEVYRNVEYWQEFTNIKEVAIIVNGIHYKITSAENKTMAITSRGDGNDKYAGVVEIPTSVIYNDVTYKVTSIGEKAFMDCTDLTSVVIPNSITSISQSAFFGCTGLTEMTIPNSVTSIGIGALAGCSGLKSIVVEEGNAVYDSRGNCNAIVETATNTLIAGCNNTVIPADVVSIGEGAFYGCSGLISITIPEGVALIGASAFEDCIGLTEMHVNAINPPTVRVNTFSNVDKTIPVYVPAGCAEVYRNVEYWQEFTNIKEVAIIVNGIYYKITSAENKTMAITSRGDGNDKYAGVVEIPTSVIYNDVTYKVASIGEKAFMDCTDLTSVVIPNSITSISQSAFFGCTGLTEMTIPNSVTSIGIGALAGCLELKSIVVEEGNAVYDSRGNCNAIVETATNTLIAGCNYTVIPADVVSIGVWAFYDCDGLISISIPNGVTAIGESAFYDCNGLKKIIIPDSVTSIGASAFYNCSSLTEIHIKATIPPIIYNGSVFYNVNKSIPVYVPEGCAEVYRNAEGWREFTNIIAFVPLAIVKTTPGDGEEVDSFSGIVVEFNKPVYIANEAGAIVKDAMGETIAILSDEDASSLTTKMRLCTVEPIVIEGAYTVNIPAEMFATDGNEEYNDNIVVNFTVKLPTLPVGTAIEVDGIYYKVTNSDNRTVEVTFKGSTYYEYTDEYTGVVEIPENVTFKGVKYSVTAIGQSAFKDCASLTSVVIPGSVTSIGAVAFEDCAALKGVTIGNGVTVIGDYAFYNCIELASVNIPEGVTTIGKSAFNGCSSLASVEIPNSVTSLGGAAFEGCTALYSVTIGNGVTAIGDYTFYKCTTLTSVTIPEKVATIGQSAFQACSSLREIISEAITPPTVKTNTFNQVDKSIPVYVPEWSVDNYRKASFWNQFTNIIGVANGVIVVNGVYYKKTSDEDKTVEVTFCGRSYDEYAGEYTGEVEIPDSVTYQGVVYSVTAIGKSAFKGCTSLTSVVIPGSVTEIGGAAFEGCTALNSVTIGNGVTAIGDYAFYKCVALTSVTIPENVAMIGLSAYQACTGFVEIVSEAITPPAIESSTFSYVDKSISLYVPGGCADAYSMADYWSEFTYIEEIGAVDEVSFAAETIKVGAMKEFSLPISMKNSMPVVGVQCDIELPDGLTAVKNNGSYEVTLSSRANDYRVETILRQDGLLRVLIYPKSVSPIVIYDEELYIIKNSYINKQESAQSAQEKNLEYPTAPKPISGRNGELFTITLMPNEHYSTNDNVVIRNAEAITRSYSIQEIADLVIACTVQGDATGDESDVSDIDNVESATRIYAAGNKIVIESPQAQKAQIIMMDGLVLRKFLQLGHNEIPMQQGIYIVSVGSIAKKIVIR